MCLWKPSALFDRAVIHAKERGHSAREGEETIQQDSSDRTGVANPSWLTHLENLHLSDAAVGVAHATPTPHLWAGHSAGRNQQMGTSVTDRCSRNQFTSQQAARGCEYFETSTHSVGSIYRQKVEPENQIPPDLRIRESSSCLTGWLLSSCLCWPCEGSHEINSFQQLPALSVTLDQKLKMHFIVSILYLSLRLKHKPGLNLFPNHSWNSSVWFNSISKGEELLSSQFLLKGSYAAHKALRNSWQN